MVGEVAGRQVEMEGGEVLGRTKRDFLTLSFFQTETEGRREGRKEGERQTHKRRRQCESIVAALLLPLEIFGQDHVRFLDSVVFPPSRARAGRQTDRQTDEHFWAGPRELFRLCRFSSYPGTHAGRQTDKQANQTRRRQCKCVVAAYSFRSQIWAGPREIFRLCRFSS